jgi:hypothetical protein
MDDCFVFTAEDGREWLAAAEGMSALDEITISVSPNQWPDDYCPCGLSPCPCLYDDGDLGELMPPDPDFEES